MPQHPTTKQFVSQADYDAAIAANTTATSAHDPVPPTAEQATGDAPPTTPGGGGSPTPKDAPPKKRGPGRPKGSKNRTKGTGSRARTDTKAAKTVQIEQALAEMLGMPAIPFAMLGDEFCASHFATAGPGLAKQLATMSESNPQLRQVLERALDVSTMGALVMALFMYLMPPLLHHGIIPAPPMVAAMMGVPVPQPPSAPANGAERMPGGQSA